jgi:phosphohistidine phosphatase SixA
VRILAVALVLLAVAQSAAAQQTFFVVRHAERADSSGTMASRSGIPNDPSLSDAGRVRAARLATMLRSAGITHVFTTEFKRTRETAEPFATAQKLKAVMAPAQDLDALVSVLKATKGSSLVVGHSNTIPDLLKRLGIKDEIKIDEQEYDNLFVVVRAASGAASLVRLRY